MEKRCFCEDQKVVPQANRVLICLEELPELNSCIHVNFDMIYARAQARKTRENGSEFEQEKMCLELPKFCFDIAGKVSLKIEKKKVIVSSIFWT
ncbi:hypothetical protein ACS0TY_030180 [Phlomoides rotata]